MESTQSPPHPTRTGPVLLASGLFLVTLGFLVGRIWLQLTACSVFSSIELGSVMSNILPPTAFAALGAIIVRYHPENRIGWLCLAAGISSAFINFSDEYINCALSGSLPTDGIAYLAWLNYNFTPYLFLIPVFFLLPFWFPDGRFLTPRWRRSSLALIGAIIFLSLAFALVPDFRGGNFVGSSYDLDNPLGQLWLPPWWGPTLRWVILFLTLFTALAAVLSTILRFRRSQGVERQQMKWFAYFLGTFVAIQLIFFELFGPLLGPYLEGSYLFNVFTGIYIDLIIPIVFLGFPLVIGIAVFKYRLYDIDIIIRRTLVYGILTVLLALLYFGIVTLLQNLLSSITGQQSTIAIVISTLIIAAVFTPLRRRIQDTIDRRFYRRKYDAEKALAAFGLTVREEVDLESLTRALLAVVDETMQPESAAVWLREGPNR
ncbi:MAG: hypothetical protein R3335_10790 [Anaerolineales bacterium]|nr:hypothetical protein [Anaerolineales bacterium]